MSSSRDDIVIRPRFVTHEPSAAQARAREERVLARAAERHSALSRFVRARLASRAAGLGADLIGFGADALGFATRSSPAALVAPVGTAVASTAMVYAAAAIVSIAVATRLLSGRSFENMGQYLNDVLIGDLDEDALASQDVRSRLGNDRDVARIAGREGNVNAQMKAIFGDLQAMQKRDRVGRAMFMSDRLFEVQGTFDLLILRARDVFLQYWRGGSGPGDLQLLIEGLHHLGIGAKGKEGVR